MFQDSGQIEPAIITDTPTRRRSFDSEFKITTPYDEDAHMDTPERQWRKSDEYKTRWDEWSKISRAYSDAYNKAALGYYENNLKGTYDDVYKYITDYYNIYNIIPYVDFKNFNYSEDEQQKINEILYKSFNDIPEIGELYDKSSQAYAALEMPEGYSLNPLDRPDIKPIANTVTHVSDLYNTRRAKRQIRRADKYARRRLGHSLPSFYNIDELNTSYYKDNGEYNLNWDSNVDYTSGKVNIGLADARTALESNLALPIWDPEKNTFVYRTDDEIEAEINSILGERGGNYRFTPEVVTAHELAHTRTPYGTTYNHDTEKWEVNPDIIRPKYLKWLTPTTSANDHDTRSSESYADLMGLRADLYASGIADGTKRRYRTRDIRRARELIGDNRYLAQHSNNRLVRKALNRIWANGGKM